MKTYSAKPSDIQRKWWIIDAEDLVLGRLAAEASKLLRGKHKPLYSPNLDCGDHVIIINAEKIHLTGNKLADKVFFWHTGYPGGIKEINAEKTLDGKHPERLVKRAITRMIPRSPLGRDQVGKLRVYAGAEHPHTAQQPEVFDVASKNIKNKKRVA
jgi:large subunit ribosomal protein L13